MLAVMARMGMSGPLVEWVARLYGGLRARLLINGECSGVIQVGSGVRQGCPMSPVLFVMSMEPLAQVIRDDQRIRGVTIPGNKEQGKVTLYVDDVAVLCRDTASVWRAMEGTGRFCAASGLKVNARKGELMAFGDSRLFEDRPPELRLQTEEITVLGVTFCKDRSGEHNWEKRIRNAKGRLSKWAGRWLTMAGRIMVVKVEILPTLSYLAQVFPPGKREVKALTSALFGFIWGGGMERVRRAILCMQVGNGGRGAPNVEYTLNSTFVCNALRLFFSAEPRGKAACYMRYRLTWRLRGLGMTQAERSTPLDWPGGWLSDVVGGYVGQHGLNRWGGRWSPREVRAEAERGEACDEVPGARREVHRQIWRNMSSAALTKEQRDLSWLAVRDKLETRGFMYARQMARTPKCPRGCNGDESAVHVMVACPFAQEVWRRSKPLLARFALSKVTTWDVMWGELRGVGGEDRDRAWAIIGATKEALWKARKKELEGSQMSPLEACYMARRLLERVVEVDRLDEGLPARRVDLRGVCPTP
ncbi:tyrosinase isoform X2 [Petromyzon marinus]|uniref:tyrosinase isoform X2 n=1 Tax=Petromyzon marinus TaxID=7757 RepID=UPI003F6FD673